MQKTPALIIKKQNIGETDRILTIFSPILGKKRVIAKAVRRPLSRLAGHLDTMMLSQLMLTDEEDLPKVTSAELNEPFNNIRESLHLTQKAFAVTKLIERVILEDVSERRMFQLTLDSLTMLDSREPWKAVWLYFLSQLTSRLGVGITSFSCGSCREPIVGAAYWLPLEHAFSCPDCRQFAEESLRLEANCVKLLWVLNHQPYQTIRSIKIPETIALDVEEIYLRLVTEWLNKPWQSYASLDRN